MEVTYTRSRVIIYCLYFYKRRFWSLPGIRLWDEIVDDHIDHCARGERQGVWQQWLDERHCEYAHESGNWLHHAAQLTVPADDEKRPDVIRKHIYCTAV